MATIEAGRMTAEHDGDVVVFVIGMRVNRWRRARAWFPTFTAMPRMLAELEREKERGLLGYWGALSATGPVIVQYWRDLESLMTYASASEGEHRPAWKAFYERAHRNPGAVGVWHETYRSPAGQHEAIYVDMPPTGLAAATGVAPVVRRNRTARDRLAA